MGPAAEMATPDASTSAIKLTQLPRLARDGENWLTYQEKVVNAIKARKLCRHLTGTARKPAELIEKDDGFYLASDSDSKALTDKQVDEHEELLDAWEEKEAQLRELVYNTVDNSTFLQIKGQPTAAKMWDKLVSIYGSKGSAQFEATLLGKLQNARFTDDGDMRAHLGNMTTLRERLDKVGAPLSDAQFNAYIQTSLSLSPRFQPLLTTLNTSARLSKVATTSEDLIWQLNEEANRFKLEEGLNKANAAMFAAHTKAQAGPSGNRNNDKGKGRSKSDNKCTNCKKKGHTKENCFAKGGGKADQAPDWWKERQQKAKEKKELTESANIINDNSAEENFAFLAIDSANSHSEDENTPAALVVTSGHNHEAYAVSPSAGVIVDCGASSHFSPDRSKFVNYVYRN
jgi:hypothetical protein